LRTVPGGFAHERAFRKIPQEGLFDLPWVNFSVLLLLMVLLIRLRAYINNRTDTLITGIQKAQTDRFQGPESPIQIRQSFSFRS
jgi:hypothetical protein